MAKVFVVVVIMSTIKLRGTNVVVVVVVVVIVYPVKCRYLLVGQVRSGQVRSRTMRATRQLLPPPK